MKYKCIFYPFKTKGKKILKATNAMDLKTRVLYYNLKFESNFSNVNSNSEQNSVYSFSKFEL